MSGFYRPIRKRKLLRLLLQYGFVHKAVVKHDKYVRESDSKIVIVPRSSSLSPVTSRQICEYLIEECGIPEEGLMRLL